MVRGTVRIDDDRSQSSPSSITEDEIAVSVEKRDWWVAGNRDRVTEEEIGCGCVAGDEKGFSVR
ncbi:hypothetical protein C1H46_009753 [Malus baccata]|uniref:Uncharacterized protein n=1 Tax=Malus baccata TaxID=106549 RepID=A0A540N2B7_MALBA|nr:hypothetical protein C1H46_009753 [Malus baccata]